MSFFGFGAFSTPVGQLIGEKGEGRGQLTSSTVEFVSLCFVERATDNAASAGNLALHLEVCDLINETDNGPKDAVAAIRKRLTGSYKNFHIINLTITVSGQYTSCYSGPAVRDCTRTSPHQTTQCGRSHFRIAGHPHTLPPLSQCS